MPAARSRPRTPPTRPVGEPERQHVEADPQPDVDPLAGPLQPPPLEAVAEDLSDGSIVEQDPAKGGVRFRCPDCDRPIVYTGSAYRHAYPSGLCEGALPGPQFEGGDPFTAPLPEGYGEPVAPDPADVSPSDRPTGEPCFDPSCSLHRFGHRTTNDLCTAGAGSPTEALSGDLSDSGPQPPDDAENVAEGDNGAESGQIGPNPLHAEWLARMRLPGEAVHDIDPARLEALYRALRAPFPPEMVGKLPKGTSKNGWKGVCRPKDQGGSAPDGQDYYCGKWHALPAAHLDYVGHGAVTARLGEVDAEWQWSPRAGWDPATGGPVFIRSGNNPVGLWIDLEVLGVTRPGFGSCPSNQNDAEKVLIGDAIRNAAMRFGVAVEMWIKGHGDDDEQIAATQVENAQGEPASDEDIERLRNQANALPRPARKILRDLMNNQHLSTDFDTLPAHAVSKVVAILTGLESRARAGEFEPKAAPPEDLDQAPWDQPELVNDAPPLTDTMPVDFVGMTAPEIMALCDCNETGCPHELAAADLADVAGVDEPA